MKRILLQNIIVFIKVVATLVVIGALFYLIFIEKSEDYASIGKYISLLITFIIFFIKTKKKPVLYQKKEYEHAYKIFLEGAFCEDKGSYEKLIKCADLFAYRKYDEAHKLLHSLEHKCTRTKDYVAVYGFHGVCYGAQHKDTDAINAYTKALQYDMSVSTLWSNLGLCHLHLNNTEEAHQALSNAIMYDAYNIYAYINMAQFFHTYGQPQAALHYITKALELAPTNKDVLSWTALTYKILGDDENTKKYSNLYIKNGGSKSNIRKMHKLFS